MTFKDDFYRTQIPFIELKYQGCTSKNKDRGIELTLRGFHFKERTLRKDRTLRGFQFRVTGTDKEYFLDITI